MAASDYENPLIVATPFARGQRVRDAQWLLAGHNAWASKESPIRTYAGRIDGVFGPETAVAAKQAKWWLGYPAEHCDPIFGVLLYNLLIGDSHLSGEYAARRKKRLDAQLNSLKLKAFNLAVAEIGTHEFPFGSNLQKYGAWYGVNGVAWCAIFASWCIAHAGRSGWKYASVAQIYADALNGRNGMSLTYSPQRGDLCCYTLHGEVDAHVAFFDDWMSNSHDRFHDLGGNTGPTNISNGGAVMRGERDISQVHRFVRLTF